MKLADALFNWLQITLVAEARPTDAAAQETVRFFSEILEQDHQVLDVRIVHVDDTMYFVQFESSGKSRKQMFDRESAEQLLRDLESNPIYLN